MSERIQFYARLEIPTAVLLELWAEIRGLSKPGMLERILEDRVNRQENKQEIWQGIEIRAQLEGKTPQEWIVDTLKGNGTYHKYFNAEEVNWEVLFK